MTFHDLPWQYLLVTKRDKHQQALYLERDRAQLLDELAAETRIPKAVLLREAVDMLLTHHGKLKAPKRK